MFAMAIGEVGQQRAGEDEVLTVPLVSQPLRKIRNRPGDLADEHRAGQLHGFLKARVILAHLGS